MQGAVGGRAAHRGWAAPGLLIDVLGGGGGGVGLQPFQYVWGPQPGGAAAA